MTNPHTRLEQWGLTLVTDHSAVGLTLPDLVIPALRRNPRRVHLLVSTVLGKHLPADPRTVHGFGVLLGHLVAVHLSGAPVPTAWAAAARAELRGAAGSLIAELAADPVPTPGPVVIGFAETATALGHSVADALAARFYLHSTRRLLPGASVSATFEEGHSHASTHFLTPLADAGQPEPLAGISIAGADPAAGRAESAAEDVLVLVDDELTTGRTAIATIAALPEPARRSRYVVAVLTDLRSAQHRSEFDSAATALGVTIDVVALASGSVILPTDLLERAEQWPGDPVLELAAAAPGPPIRPGWPPDLPSGAATGLRPDDRKRLDRAANRAAQVIRERIPAAARRILVVGSEEFLAVPVRIAAALAESGYQVRVQSTTRSPVKPVDEPGYPLRRSVRFQPAEDELPDGPSGVGAAPRFLHNGTFDVDPAPGPADVVVLIADREALIGDDCFGALAARLAAESTVLTVVIDGATVVGLRSARGAPAVAEPDPPLPPPLFGPAFGSYPAGAVTWLLTDLSAVPLEGGLHERERLIQSGQGHYAESLPIEYRPSAEYRILFESVLAESAGRLARAVGAVTELVIAERGPDVVLASLARAGTPIGILMARWARRFHQLDWPHYTVSIVRDRGIDPVALTFLARRHDPARVLFVDGWTGKGAIVRELGQALREFAVAHGPIFDPELAVLADPGSCTRMFGTRDDFLIASACLNSTVSGLVSRTVLNPKYLTPQQFHGAKFYPELAPDDVSGRFLDAVSDRFADQFPVAAADARQIAGSDRRPTFAGWIAAEALRERFGLPSVNLIKPGVGETTRVLLRRVPWRVLVRDATDPAHRHIQLLAAERGVPVEVEPDLPYACVGIIRELGDQ